MSMISKAEGDQAVLSSGAPSVGVQPDRGVRVEQTLTQLLQAVPTSQVPVASVEIPAEMAEAAAHAGKFAEAEQWADSGLRNAERVAFPDPSLDALSKIHRVMAIVHIERNEPQAAALSSRTALTLGARCNSEVTTVRSMLIAARTAAMGGRSPEARSLLDDARRVILNGPPRNDLERELTLAETGVLILLGEIDQARLWQSGLEQYALTDPICDARRVQLLTLSGERANLGNQATRLLRSLRSDASLAARVIVGSSAAAALQAVGRHSDAVVIFATTLRLAEPEHFLQTLSEHGRNLLPLLDTISAEELPTGQVPPSPAYIERLRSMVDQVQSLVSVRHHHEDRPDLARYTLSEREIQVLRLLAGTMSNREIGNELYLSVNTVKSHVKNLYAKLGVNRRVEAVNRARELGLLRQ
jgi:LuxR family maltose regulon positive regulatory protein